MRRVHRLQRRWYAVETDVGADTAFESADVEQVSHATDGQRQHRILDVGGRPIEDRVGLKEGRLDLNRLEAAIERIPVGVARSLDEHGAASAVIRVVASKGGGHGGNGLAVLSCPGR